MLLEGGFDLQPLADGLTIEVKGQVRVGGRVPGLGVDAVEYAAKTILALAQQAFQPAAELLALDLRGIGRADGGDAVRESDAPLDKAELIVKLQRKRRPVTGWQAQPDEGFAREQALIGKVVNGEHRSGPLRLVVQQCRDEPRLPVIAVHDVGFPVQAQPVARQFHRKMAEQGETLGIVRPGLAVRPEVRVAATAKITLMNQAIHLDFRARQRRGQQDGALAVAGQPERLEISGCHRRGIAWDKNAYIVAERLEGDRQTSGDVRQTAGFDQRVGFTADEQDFLHAL